MYQTFNMGMGFVIAVGEGDAEGVLGVLRENGESAQVVGRVVDGEGVGHTALPDV